MPDDLFSLTAEPVPRPEPRVYSVSEITRAVRMVIEEGVGVVWVEGEISNYRKQASGHQYFTLKDAGSQLPCVLFARGGAWRKSPQLADGMQVQVRGEMTVYEARGQYQLNVQLVQAGGAGLLQAKFEALKRKLDAEGLFDPARKRPLPLFPVSIAIVTSPTGAALRDMLHVLARRAPWLRVVVAPVRVQGDGAAEEIAAAIGEVNRFAELGLPPVELIVVTRGGGSAEDLWEFNEEIVARAIVASRLSVVSAVGHEIDFTICDFAADLRAPTPSAAAELVAPDRVELFRRLGEMTARARRHVLIALEQSRSRLALLRRADLFREPAVRLREAAQRVDLAANALERSVRDELASAHARLGGASAQLRHHRPDQRLALLRQQLGGFRRQMADRIAHALSDRRQRWHRLMDAVRFLAPDAPLARGYSLTRAADGKVIRSVEEVRDGMRVVTRVSDGEFASKVSGQ